MKRIIFPKNFLWGTATSAFQLEGGIENSDWSKAFPAGIACDHYNKYEEDFNLARSLNQNAHRFSIEWSRIEPKKGVFDGREIEHYRNVLLSLKSRGMKTMVTLHHFTNPLWLAELGGWKEEEVVFYFSRFAEKVFREYKKLVDFWVTLNEPISVYAPSSYLLGRWPPKEKDLLAFLKVIKNQISAHEEAYLILHRLDVEAKVGIAKNNSCFEPSRKNSIPDRFSVFLANYVNNKFFLNRVRNNLDFIGLNYYFHKRIRFPFSAENENKKTSDLGWEIYPEGIYHVLKDLQEYNLPIYITENGLADRKDKLRKEFIKQHLLFIHKAIEEGVNVKGYFHWSLIDNFEWDSGFDPRFGLIEIDYKTLKRKPRPSAFYYAKICEENGLEINNLPHPRIGRVEAGQ